MPSDLTAPAGADTRVASNHGQRDAVFLVVPSTAILALWTAMGAYRWNGYPSAYPGGAWCAVIIPALAATVLFGIVRICVAERTVGFGTVVLAASCWTIVKCGMSSLFPPISDEAYHWLWARRLDLCYYDHPAMVAWLARPFVGWLPGSTAALRASPILLSAAMPILAYILARRTILDARVATRAALLVMLIPVFGVGSLALVPSVAVNFFWLLSVTLMWRALNSDRIVHWVLLGVAYGAALNSNFTTFLLPGCAALFVLLSRGDRRLLSRPGPYWALLVACVCFLPTLIWNAGHDWETFAFNFSRRHHPFKFRPQSAANFLGQFLLFASPVAALGMIAWGCRSAWRGIREADRANLFLACMGFGPILVFLVISFGHSMVTAYYAAPGFVPLLILFVSGVTHRRDSMVQARVLWLRLAARIGWVATALSYALLIVPAVVPSEYAYRVLNGLPGPFAVRSASKRIAEVYGWNDLGHYVDAHGRFRAAGARVLMSPSYAQSSMIMFFARHAEYAYAMDEGKSPFGQQFHRWGSLSRLAPGTDALILRAGWADDPDAERRDLERSFESLERVDTSAPAIGATLKYFTIYQASGFRGRWPPPTQ